MKKIYVHDYKVILRTDESNKLTNRGKSIIYS